ncbi:MAG: HEAT repeat domain-containing protein [Myxococcota bacterium]
MRRLVLQLVAFVLLACASGCLTRGMAMSPGDRVLAEVYIAAMVVQAKLLPNAPGAPEGFEVEVLRELGTTTAVGLDVAPDGDVFVAVSNRLGGPEARGVSDNRSKPYWLLDDLAARTVDDRRAYIEKWASQGGDPLSWYTSDADAVVRLRDTDGDGSLDEQREVFAVRDVVSGIGSSVLVDGDALWYTAIPDLFRLVDADGDGELEESEVVAHGFGVTTSLAGHDLHGLAWGPDGRIYFSVGDRGYDVATREGRHLRPPIVVSRGAVFRILPDGSDLEVFATGLRNPQDLVFDDLGELFTGDNNGDGVDEARLVHVVEGGDSGWSMPVQTMAGDYFHGPWEAERLWETRHAGQPAWILPPIGYVGRGPSGVAIDPGLGGLPDRLRGHVLICDYQYAAPRSGVRAYEVEPDGAGFRLASSATAIPSVLATDIVFGPDGWIYATEFDQLGGGTSRLLRYARPEHVADPRVAELAALLRAGFAHRGDDELVALLGHADRRARSGAQRALAARGAVERLGAVARDATAPLLARVHALWGLGEIGARRARDARATAAPAALGAAADAAPGTSADAAPGAAASASLGALDDLAWTRDAPAEVRAQALRVAGDAGAIGLGDELVAALADDGHPRAQRFAADSLGRLGLARAVEPLVELVRRNDDRDVVLRHAAVHALARIGDVDAVARHATDASAAVRMAVLLVLRRAEDARLARFLDDAEPLVVVEAARAIYDLRVAAAMPALAALATRPFALDEDGDGPSTYALQRRVLAANLALGRAEDALALAKFAADAAHPRAMRALALDLLGEFTSPGPRDPVLGLYRELGARPPESVYAALDLAVPALVGTDLEARAFEVALAAGRVPLPDDDLLARVRGWFESEDVKRASLRVLADRESPLLADAIASARRSRHAMLRADALEALARIDPDAAVDAVAALGERATRAERQRGYATLAAVGSPRADALLRDALARLAAGALEPALGLDALTAGRARGAALEAEVAAAERALASDDPVAARALALEGGDAVRGQRVFEGAGDCMRCHGPRGGGHGGRAGPPLAGVVRRRGRAYVLESLVAPAAEVVPGYGTVALVLENGESFAATLVREEADAIVVERGGDARTIPRAEIASMGATASGMPPMGLGLSLSDLRDVIEYVAGL